MGVIFSTILRLPRKKKSSKETLEVLENELQTLTKNGTASQQCERTFISILLIVLLLTYPLLLIVGVVSWIWFQYLFSTELIVVYLLLVIVLPLVLYTLKRLTNMLFSHRKTQFNLAIQSVREEKKKILDEVMEKEPYKVARELLEKYDPRNPQFLPRDAPLSQTRETVRQRRPVVPQSPHPALQHQTPLQTPQVTPRLPLPPQQTPFATPRVTGIPSGGSMMGATPHVSSRLPPSTPISIDGSPQFVPPGHSLGAAPGPPIPVPILPRDRSGFDKVMDFVLGDGPSNRYALICSQCHSHNGMALKDEFEFLSFRCAYCYFLNRAHKSKPTPHRSHSVSSNSSNTAATAIDNGEKDQEGEEKEMNTETVAPQSRENS